MYKLTARTTCTTTLEPGETEEQLAGKPMLTPCAKHVVAKAASNAATASANFIVVAIGESLELVGSLCIKSWISHSVKARVCPADVDDYRL